MATEAQKALAQVQREAIHAFSELLQHANLRQAEQIKRAASALTREQFGDSAYIAFVRAKGIPARR